MNQRFYLAAESAADLVDKYLDAAHPGKAKAQVRKSMEIIEEALRKFSLDQIAMSFNGGKDCLVMLILFLASVYKHQCTSARDTLFLESIYVKYENSFPEVDEFVDECCERYALRSVQLFAPMKEAFAGYLDTHTEVKAILVGIRKTDPYGEHLHYFQDTDHGWPQFTRIHPVLEWHYVEIWDFLRTLEIPYCSLYDKGFTSLGDTHNTTMNPRLRRVSETGVEFHLPAYKLVDDAEERLGRGVS